MSDESEREEIEASFVELIAEGKMEIVGEENGKPLYALTAEGRLHIENLLDQVLEFATERFAEELSIPSYMARDMLVHHAAELKSRDA